MRRKDREVTDNDRIDDIILSADCFRIGLSDGETPYIVPLSFGFTHTDGKRIFYFHGSNQGRKAELIRQNGKAAFEIDCSYKLKEAQQACWHSAFYKSVMGEGTVNFIENIEEKKQALSIIMKHYTGRDEWDFDEKIFRNAAVFKLEVSSISCKIHE